MDKNKDQENALVNMIKKDLDKIVLLDRDNEDYETNFTDAVSSLRGHVDQYSAISKDEFPAKIPGYNIDRGKKNFFVVNTELNHKMITIPRRFIDVYDKYTK